MKAVLFRLSCGILAASILLAAAGCGSNGKDNGETLPPPPTFTEAQEEVTAPDGSVPIYGEELPTRADGETTAANETTAAAATKAAESNTTAATAAQPTETATATPTTKPTETAAPTNADENLSDWAAAYQQHLLKAIAEMGADSFDMDYYRFGLIYLNNDDIPELWYIDGIGAHGATYEIMTYRNGKVVEVDFVGNELKYYEKQGVYYSFGTGSAYSGGGSYQKMTDSGKEMLDSFSYEFKSEDSAVYYINEKEVSKAEYDALDEKYTARYGKAIEVNSDTYSGFLLKSDSVKKNCK